MPTSRAVEIEGPAGRIEGILQEASTLPALRLALVCHPHPLGGGTMHTKVVHRTARALQASRHHVLRFNFRGVGASRGAFDDGVGERADAEAALAWLRRIHPGLPATVAGFSFGSWVGLGVGCRDEDVSALIGIAPPANIMDFSFLADCRKPKLFIHGTADTVAPLASFEPLFDALLEPKELVRVEGGTHLLVERLDRVEAAVKTFASRLAGA